MRLTASRLKCASARKPIVNFTNLETFGLITTFRLKRVVVIMGLTEIKNVQKMLFLDRSSEMAELSATFTDSN